MADVFPWFCYIELHQCWNIWPNFVFYWCKLGQTISPSCAINWWFCETFAVVFFYFLWNRWCYWVFAWLCYLKKKAQSGQDVILGNFLSVTMMTPLRNSLTHTWPLLHTILAWYHLFDSNNAFLKWWSQRMIILKTVCSVFMVLFAFTRAQKKICLWCLR